MIKQSIISILIFTFLLVTPTESTRAEGTMTIHELYTDNITAVGNVRRVFFHALITSNGLRAWHYFGTTAAEIPPTTADPVNEYPFVQVPNDLDDLPINESRDEFESLALTIARERDGYDVRNVFFDTFEESGVTKIIEFRIQTNETNWVYYGSLTSAFGCPSGATCLEVSDVQLPRDIDGAPDDILYTLAVKVGLNREAID